MLIVCAEASFPLWFIALIFQETMVKNELKLMFCWLSFKNIWLDLLFRQMIHIYTMSKVGEPRGAVKNTNCPRKPTSLSFKGWAFFKMYVAFIFCLDNNRSMILFIKYVVTILF